MKDTTKKIFVGGSIALALLTPTILATQNIQSNEIEQVKNKEVKSSIPINHIHASRGNINETFEFENVHTFSRYNELSMMNISVEIEAKVDPELGLSFPEITVTNQDTGNMEFNFNYIKPIPKDIIDKGDEAIFWYINTFSGSRQKSDWEDEYFAQTFDGETGLYFALTGYGNEESIIEPLIFNITWSDDYNNGNGKSENTVYYKNLEDDSVSLKYKTKKTGPKSIGATDAYGSNQIEDMKYFSNLELKDPETGREKTYMFYLHQDWFPYYEAQTKFNIISNSVEFANPDFSQDAIDKYYDRLSNSQSSNYVYLPTIYFYDVVEANSLNIDWTSTAEIDLDDLPGFSDALIERGDAYNSEFPSLQTNGDAIYNSIVKVFENDGNTYLIEKVALTKSYFEDTEESKIWVNTLADFYKGDIFKEIVENGSLLWSGKEYDYVNEGGNYEEYIYLATGYNEFKTKAGFISSSETWLIIFSIASIVGLGLAIFFLIRSANKEEEGVEIVMGGE